MEKFLIVILSIVISALVGTMGYYIKSVHKEFKRLITELTDYTNQLRHLIVGIQTQIEKGIETDIVELKDSIKNNTARINKHEAYIAALKQRTEK